MSKKMLKLSILPKEGILRKLGGMPLNLLHVSQKQTVAAYFNLTKTQDSTPIDLAFYWKLAKVEPNAIFHALVNCFGKNPLRSSETAIVWENPLQGIKLTLELNIYANAVFIHNFFISLSVQEKDETFMRFILDICARNHLVLMDNNGDLIAPNPSDIARLIEKRFAISETSSNLI